MTTGWYQVDHPNRNYPQFRARREPFSGVITVHATAGALDRIAPDTGAENVSGFISRRGDPGSYYRLSDTDSRVPQIPLMPYECFHTGIHGANRHAGSVAGAFHPNDLDINDQLTHLVINNMALDAVDEWREWKTPQLEWVRFLTVDQVNSRRMPGFIHHGAMDPATRSDAWWKHPQRAQLDELFLTRVRAAMGSVPSQPTEEDVSKNAALTRETDRVALKARVGGSSLVIKFNSGPGASAPMGVNRWANMRDYVGGKVYDDAVRNPGTGQPEDLIDPVIYLVDIGDGDLRFHIDVVTKTTGRTLTFAQKGPGVPHHWMPAVYPG